MIDFPEDPLRSVFAPSVVAAYHSACRFLRLHRDAYGLRKDLLDRIWHVWAQCISCLVSRY